MKQENKSKTTNNKTSLIHKTESLGCASTCKKFNYNITGSHIGGKLDQNVSFPTKYK